MTLSVIVPVYNVEKYLDDCLLSLSKQGFIKGEHEVIVVNDGSTDNSEAIIDKYCSGGGYFVKVNKENGGVSSARNLGLEVATGEYVAFVDSDDMIGDGWFTKLIDVAKDSQLDGLGYYSSESLDGLDCVSENLSEFICEYERQMVGPVWSMIFRRKIIEENRLRFDTSIKYYEDLLFFSQFVYLSKKLKFLEKKVYFYRVRGGSATRISNLGEKTYGSFSVGEEWRILNDINVAKKMKVLLERYNDTIFTGPKLSPLLCEYLWVQMRKKIKPSVTFGELKKIGVTLKDVSKEDFKGGLKAKFRYLVFRFALFYRLSCFICRIFKKA